MDKTDTVHTTDEQKKPACHAHGSACVIAGAGTGKTLTLTERIVYLVESRRIDPARIWATTFTRKATAELYHKLYDRLGEVAHRLRISTIDALIWDLAKQAMHRGFMHSARLIGEAHHRVLLLEAAWETIGWNKHSLRSLWTDNADRAGLVGLMEGCVRAELAAGHEKVAIKKSVSSRLKDLQGRKDLDFAFAIPTYEDLNRAVKKYFEKLVELGASDYDLLARSFLHCLKQHKQLAETYASEVDEILVDEFQDTSRIQAEILVLLSGKRPNIWVVGDQCQQIYEWRGAGPDNLSWFRKKTRAKVYFLTGNWRSTQTILDSAYCFLSRRVPSLKQTRLLQPLKSMRNGQGIETEEPIFTGTLDQALWLVRQRLDANPDLTLGDVAILSRKLDKTTVKQIEEKAQLNGFSVQLHSSRADRAMERTLGRPPNWKPGRALNNLYADHRIQKVISGSLRKNDFSGLRMLRPLATAAEALDSTSREFTFREAWPALKITQDRDIPVTPAVASRPDAIQVMTIHAAKGLEFPVVLLMKLGKGSRRSFPNPNDPEDCRVAYVGATRARDLLILVHTSKKPVQTLSAFGKSLVPIRRNKREVPDSTIQAPAVLSIPPLVAATHLDYYEQCPLQFAAYHEGRFLPKWSRPQSMGSRMHKSVEYWLRKGMINDASIIDQCFKKGFQEGDSPLRRLPHKVVEGMETAFRELVKHISETCNGVVVVEQRFRYVQPSGQVEGVVDAVLERYDTAIVLKEWKTAADILPDRVRQYELQARVGALAMVKQNLHPVQVIDIVPVLSPEKTVSIAFDNGFVDKTMEMLEGVFKSLKDRRYEPRRGKHCIRCDLKPQCPAWRKT